MSAASIFVFLMRGKVSMKQRFIMAQAMSVSDVSGIVGMQKLAHSLSSPNVLEFIEPSRDYGIVEVPAPKSWTGKSIPELNVRAKLGINIIAIKSGENVNVASAAQYVIRKDDILAVLGDCDSLAVLQEL